MRRHPTVHLVSTLAALTVSTDVVAAHELGATRFSAPIPLSAFYAGAAATVVLSAAWLAWNTERIPTGAVPLFPISARFTRVVYIVTRFGFSLLVVLAIAEGLLGRQMAAENVATLFVWPVWLTGIALVAIVLGSPWLVLSPWRGLHKLFERIEGGTIGLRRYPDWLGVWPALAGFVLVVGLVGNLMLLPRSPAQTAGLVALYAVLMVAGGLTFGTSWFRHADFFEVLYGQYGRVAFFQASVERNTAWTLSLRTPWQGCTTTARRPGIVPFVVAMVYTASFDGFTNTPEYQSIRSASRDALPATLEPHTGITLYFVGLLAFVVTYLAAMGVVEHVGESGGETLETARAFAPTVIPIAAAYEIAHNYIYVLRSLDRLVDAVLIAVDVPGFSIWAVLPTLPAIDVSLPVPVLGILAIPAFWASQVVLIVVGHVVAVVAAHAVAIDRSGTVDRAPFPLVLVMVAYTGISLWILSRPIVS